MRHPGEDVEAEARDAHVKLREEIGARDGHVSVTSMWTALESTQEGSVD